MYVSQMTILQLAPGNRFKSQFKFSANFVNNLEEEGFFPSETSRMFEVATDKRELKSHPAKTQVIQN